MRKRQDPLADRNVRKYAVDEVGRCICHPAASTRVTEAPPFARKPDHAIQTACAAVNANETPCQHATVQERAEFALHKVRDVPIALALPGEKRFQMAGDHLV